MARFLTGYPISKAKLDEILDLIEAGENVTSLWMPMSCRTDFAIKLQTKEGIPTKLAEKLTFVYLDLSLSQEFVERQLEESLSRYSDKIGARNKLTDIVARGKRIVLILDNFSFTNLDWVKYILSLRHEVPPETVTFLILAFESEFYAQKTTLTDFALIYHNIVKIPYLNPNETREWIRFRAKELKISLSDKDVQLGADFCGGIMGLLINLFRAYRRFGTVDKSLVSEQMRDTVQHLWGRFSERERHILKSIVTTGKVPPYTFELRYMREHNLLTADNKIIGEWVKDVVGENKETEIKLGEETMEWDGVNIAELFTDKEVAVLRALLVKQELTRDEIAKLMWGSKAVDEYSDWAIDQLFSRLRKKLELVGIGEEKIKTLKGKGFKIENIKLTL